MKRKSESRIRRATKGRAQIRKLEAVRLSVHRTSQHIYAQVIDATGTRTVASASTLDKDLRDKLKCTGNVDAAKEVGKLVAQRAIAAGINKVAFDRSGFAYHGRIKALADAARETGLIF